MFKIYEIDLDYIKALNAVDNKVQYDSTGNYNNKPYIGVLFRMKSMDYVVPLSSPKPKHLTMRNQADFFKIDGGNLGVININNMIPVRNQFNIIKLKDIDALLNSTDPRDVRYGNLLNNQLAFINQVQNRNSIRTKAETLYEKYIDNSLIPRIKDRCVNFPELEKELNIYLTNKTK